MSNIHIDERELALGLFKNLKPAAALYEVTYDDGGAPDLLCLYANEAFASNLGFTAEEATGKRFLEMTPLDTAWIPVCADIALQRERAQTFETFSESISRHVNMQAYSPRYGQVAIAVNIRPQPVRSKDSREDRRHKVASLLQAMPFGFCICDIICDENGEPVDIRFDILNDAYEIMNGYRVGSLQGKRLLEVYPDANTDYFGVYSDAVANNSKITYLYKVKKSHTEKTYEAVCYPQGEKCFLCIISDVTERVEAERTLAISQAESIEMADRLERIINTAPIVFVLVIDGRIAKANEYSRKYLGLEVGDDVRHFFEDPDEHDDIVRMVARDETASNFIIRINMSNGETHRFLLSFFVTGFERRKAYILWAIDVEQDEIKNDLIRATQQSLQTVLDALPIPVRIIDIESAEIVYVNDSFLELLEYDSADEICGQTIDYILPRVLSDGTTSAERKNMVKTIEEPVAMETEYRANKTGRIVEALIAARRIDYKGRNSSVGIIKDLSAEKEQARILLDAVEREKEANRAKSLFLANMSHEIRTPMNGIIGMTDLLLGEELPKRQLQYVKDIKVAAESLLDIINDILDLSKIGEGKLRILPVDIELGVLLRNIISMMGFSARAKGLDFIDDIRINSPEYVRVDDVRLKQVIVNLLSNAIKFTKTGYVKLTVKIEEGNIVFEIGDTGIGVKPEDIPRMFVEFEQADKRKNRGIRGTGLGLPISKNLVEMMGGRIWVESEYGTGTTFFVTIPYVRGDEAAVEAIDTEFKYISAPMAQVLLVDDIQTNLTVGAGLLRLCGITADVAISGPEAIELIRENDYDIVFMDHMMSGMDGIEAMRAIRDMGGKYRDLTIIALTANAMNESRDFLLNSGMDDFLSKPIDKRELMSILKRWLPADKIKIGEISGEGVPSAVYSNILAAAASIEGLNIELALDRVGGAQDFVEDSIREAANEIGGHLRKMDSLLSENDLHNFSIEIHGLKNVLASIGAMRNSELAAELEIAAKAGNMPLCVKKFTLFTDIIESFMGQIQSILREEDEAERAEEIPKGGYDFLRQKIVEAVGLLEKFEDEDAVACLNDLCKFTFGAEKDAILNEAKSAAQNLDYNRAILLLKDNFKPCLSDGGGS